MIQRIMGHAIQLPQGLWVRLNIAWVVFFLVCGFANLYVVFTYPNFWVDFKVFGSLGMTLLFLIGQGLFLASPLCTTPIPAKSPRTDMLYAIIARDIPCFPGTPPGQPPGPPGPSRTAEGRRPPGTRRPAPGDRQQRPRRRRLHRQPDRRRIRFAAAAQSWAEADPYRAAGVYAEVVVKLFKKVLP